MLSWQPGLSCFIGRVGSYSCVTMAFSPAVLCHSSAVLTCIVTTDSKFGAEFMRQHETTTLYTISPGRVDKYSWRGWSAAATSFYQREPPCLSVSLAGLFRYDGSSVDSSYARGTTRFSQQGISQSREQPYTSLKTEYSLLPQCETKQFHGLKYHEKQKQE